MTHTTTYTIDAGEVPIWKSEASLWMMMIDGRKTWDGRIWNLMDPRCYHTGSHPPGLRRGVVAYVGFLNVETDQLAVFELDYVDQAGRLPSPWVLMILGPLQYVGEDVGIAPGWPSPGRRGRPPYPQVDA